MGRFHAACAVALLCPPLRPAHALTAPEAQQQGFANSPGALRPRDAAAASTGFGGSYLANAEQLGTARPSVPAPEARPPAADALAALAHLIAPRAAATLAKVFAVDGGEEVIDGACCRQPPVFCAGGAAARVSCAWVAPQVVRLLRLAGCAAPRPRQTLAEVSATLGGLVWEAEIFWRLVVLQRSSAAGGTGSTRAARAEAFRAIAHAIAAGVVLAVAQLLATGTDSRQYAAVAAECVLAVGAIYAAVSPLLSLVAGRRGMAVARALAIAMVLLAGGGHDSQELTMLLMLAGPAALALAACGVGIGDKGRRPARIVVQRRCFLDSSVEQLTKLRCAQLFEPPRIVYVGAPAPTCREPQSAGGSGGSTASAAAGVDMHDGSSGPREEGIDTGGLRRDWLSRLAGELFDPAHGLVVPVMLDGVEHARLRPGADLRHLEAAGRVLGLAMRDGQPLGVNLAAPLAHLLAHPSLPTAIDAMVTAGSGSTSSNSSTWRRCRDVGLCAQREGAGSAAVGHGAEELRRLGFSRAWLQWASPEEYTYWSTQLRSVRRVRAQRMWVGVAQRALEALVLGVAEETKALWRGLHEVPGVPLPELETEVAGTKRRREQMHAEGDTTSALKEHARLKRPRRDDGSDASLLVLPPPGGEVGTHAGGEDAADSDDEMKDKLSGYSASGSSTTAASAPEDAFAAKGAQQLDEGARFRGLGHAVEAPLWLCGCARRRGREEMEESDIVDVNDKSLESRPAKRRRLAEPEQLAEAAEADVEEEKEEATTVAAPSALQRLVAGNPDIRVEHWQELTICEPPGADQTHDGRRTMAWFWQYIHDMDLEGRANLLQWVTGFRRLPLHGFPQPYTKMTVHLLADQDGGRFPTAHTCALQLDLPAQYGSELVFRNRLAEASAYRDFHMS